MSNILIIKHGSLGDIAQASGAIQDISEFHKEDDIYFCTADPGWVTGTSYGIIAPWTNGVTQLIYEGGWPEWKNSEFPSSANSQNTNSLNELSEVKKPNSNLIF